MFIKPTIYFRPTSVNFIGLSQFFPPINLSISSVEVQRTNQIAVFKKRKVMSRNVYRSYEILCELDVVGQVKKNKKTVKLFH